MKKFFWLFCILWTLTSCGQNPQSISLSGNGASVTPEAIVQPNIEIIPHIEATNKKLTLDISVTSLGNEYLFCSDDKNIHLTSCENAKKFNSLTGKNYPFLTNNSEADYNEHFKDLGGMRVQMLGNVITKVNDVVPIQLSVKTL